MTNGINFVIVICFSIDSKNSYSFRVTEKQQKDKATCSKIHHTG